MKKFIFSLERARLWRKLIWEREEANLDKLLAESQVLSIRRTRLDREVLEALHRSSAQPILTGDQLQQLAHLQRYGHEEARRLEAAKNRLGQDIERQRGAVRKVRREFEVLDRLRDQKREEWEREVAHEEETQIGEMAVARWQRSEARARAQEG